MKKLVVILIAAMSTMGSAYWNVHSTDTDWILYNYSYSYPNVIGGSTEYSGLFIACDYREVTGVRVWFDAGIRVTDGITIEYRYWMNDYIVDHAFGTTSSTGTDIHFDQSKINSLMHALNQGDNLVFDVIVGGSYFRYWLSNDNFHYYYDLLLDCYNPYAY